MNYELWIMNYLLSQAFPYMVWLKNAFVSAETLHATSLQIAANI